MCKLRKIFSKSLMKRCEYIPFSYIDNALFLKMETINKNGFHEVWRQSKGIYSIQILCFNEDTGEFLGFDRFQWSGETDCSSGISCYDDLWTPIKLHFTTDIIKCLFSSK